MKRFLALILVLSMMLALCGCGSSQTKSTPDLDPTPRPEPTPEISESKAISLAKDYISRIPGNIARAANCSSIKSLSFGDVTCSECYTQTESKGDFEITRFYYDVHVKGTFYSVDAYGSTGSKYQFDWDICVNAAGYVDVGWSDLTPRVKKI